MTGDGHLRIRVPAHGDLQPQWEAQGYTITINNQTWRGTLTTLRRLDHGELELELDLRHYPENLPPQTRHKAHNGP